MLYHKVVLVFQKEIYFLFVISCLFLTLQKSVPNAKIGFSKAMSGGWLSIDKKAEGGPRLHRKVGYYGKNVVLRVINLV